MISNNIYRDVFGRLKLQIIIIPNYLESLMTSKKKKQLLSVRFTKQLNSIGIKQFPQYTGAREFASTFERCTVMVSTPLTTNSSSTLVEPFHKTK